MANSLDSAYPVTSAALGRWILASSIGWLVGIPLVVLILAGAETFGLSGQFAIGLGMGGSVGFFQWRRGRRAFGARAGWLWSSAVGMMIPFLICDLIGYTPDGPAVIAPAALGGLFVGFGQHRFLGTESVRTYAWLPVSLAGWTLAVVATLLLLVPGRPATGLELLQQLVALMSGGVVLGTVTGFGLHRLSRSVQ